MKIRGQDLWFCCLIRWSQFQNISKEDFLMALLPDPTIAASEYSTVKKN